MSIPDKIPEYKFVEKISSGLYGTVNLVKIGKKKYALKIQKILASDVKKSLKSKIWREIEFASFTKKHPDLFIQLHAYEFINECDHKQKISKDHLQQLDTDTKEDWNKIQKSTHCVHFLYDLVEGGVTYQNWYHGKGNKTYSELCSSVAQIAYGHYIANEAGYTLADSHFGNIMIVQDEKVHDMKLGKRKIKTSVRIVFIDYGEIYHNKYLLNKYDKEQHLEISQFISLLEYFWITIDYDEKKSGAAPKYDEENVVETIKIQSEYIFLIKDCLPGSELKYNKIPYNTLTCMIGMYRAMNNRGYHEILGYDELVQDIEKVIPQQYLNTGDFLCLYKNGLDLLTVVDYFCNKVI